MSNISELYPHNRKVFLSALENLKTHKKLGIVQATGTGKGKLAACFVEHILRRKSSAKILIAAPFNSILQNYRDSFGISSKDVKFVNYASLINLEEKDLIDVGLNFDLIIVDEFHKLGAEMRNKAINNIFVGVDSPESNCRVIGFTATPIRYLDNARDMGEELFEGNVIDGLNLEDAILDGILPGFIYNACYFGTEEILKQVEGKLKDNEYGISDEIIRNDLMVKVQELKLIYQNRLKIENIIKENTSDLGVNQKWVIFCRNKENLAEIREFCKTWFIDNPSIYAIHSDRQSVDNDRTLKEFRESKIGINVMLCVDMLNEGVHIKDLNGVIMLRKTDSPIIFLQQLGRALECGKEFKPIIFDLIGNYKGLKIENNGLVRNPISIVKDIKDKAEKLGKSNYVIVQNFTENFDNVMSEISKIDSYYWSTEEDEILKKYYSLGGYKLCQEKGLSYKSKQAISSRAVKFLGLCSVSYYWSDEEDNLIKKYYPLGGYKLCQKMGLDRSKGAIQGRSNILNLRYTPLLSTLSEEDMSIIKKYYPIGGSKLCKKKGISNLTAPQICSIARREFGLAYNNVWSKEEEEILIKYYTIEGITGCKNRGLKREDRAIQKRANELGLYTIKSIWSNEELEILEKYYPLGGSQLCMDKGLNKTASQIKSKANHLNIHKSNVSHSSSNYSEDEINLILKYYKIGGSSLCIEKGLNRTLKSINKKARDLGLSDKVIEGYSKFEDDIIRNYYPIGGYALCQKNGLENRSSGSIQQRARTLGVSNKPYWSDEEDKLIKKYYPLGGSKLCMEKGLNRSSRAINTRAQRYGIIIRNEDTWSEMELDILKKYYLIGGYKLCQNNGLNRSKSAIQHRAHRIGITKE